MGFNKVIFDEVSNPPLKEGHWYTIEAPSFLADFEIIPIPNLPNLTDLKIPSSNRGLCPLTPAPIPP